MSAKNEEIKECIIDYIQMHGYPPTVKEIGEIVGLKSSATTWCHLQQMLKNGVIETDHIGASRAIRVCGYEFVKEKQECVRIGDKEYSEIIITDSEGGVLAVITSENIIEEKSCNVKCVPINS